MVAVGTRSRVATSGYEVRTGPGRDGVARGKKGAKGLHKRRPYSMWNRRRSFCATAPTTLSYRIVRYCTSTSAVFNTTSTETESRNYDRLSSPGTFYFFRDNNDINISPRTSITTSGTCHPVTVFKYYGYIPVRRLHGGRRRPESLAFHTRPRAVRA